jgi:hypothetical protein
MIRRLHVSTLVALTSLLAACSSSSPAGNVTTGTGDAGADAVAPPPEPKAGCNPIIGDDCLTPFPSSFYLASDSTSATGVRVAIPANALPVQSTMLQLKPDRMNQKDGFSALTPYLVYFAQGVDPTNLFGWKDPSASLTPTSPVQVIDYETGQRVIAFAELDDNINGGGQRQALIVRPLVRLSPGKRYVIALLDLKDPTGAPIVPAPFKALRDGTALSKALTAQKPRYDEIFALLAKAGVDRTHLSLAFDVVTASDATANGHLQAMRDHAFSLLAAGSLHYTINSQTDDPGPHTARTLELSIDVPSYLSDESGKSMMNFGPDGQPAQKTIGKAPVTITIPACAKTATGPLKTTFFGHGLFGTAKDTIESAPAQAAGDQLCTIFVGTDWLGLASNDVPNLKDLLTTDLNNFYVISDRLQQAHVNAQTMTRMFLTTIKNDPALAIGGKPVTDGSEVYYFGVSDGGIQGTTYMGLSPDVPVGVLNVPGGNWSMLINRSVDFAQFSGLLSLLIPDPLDRQVAVAITQPEWDYTDAATWAPHLISDPLPGVPKKRILVQESLGDAQVSNITTRLLARTIGLPTIDLTEPVPGLAAGMAPLPSAYTQWNSHKMPLPPLDNTALDKDNGAHDSVWASTLALSQISQFTQKSGQVVSVCMGPCNLP